MIEFKRVRVQVRSSGNNQIDLWLREVTISSLASHHISLVNGRQLMCIL